MPAFYVKVCTLVPSGMVTVLLPINPVVWTSDKARPQQSRPATAYQVPAGTSVHFQCILEGDLYADETGVFTTWVAEGNPKPVLVPAPNDTGVDLTSWRLYTFPDLGHFVLGFRLESDAEGADGGAVLVHIDVVE